MHDFTGVPKDDDDDLVHYEEGGDFELDLADHEPAPASFDDERGTPDVFGEL